MTCKHSNVNLGIEYIYIYPEPGLYGLDIHFARQMSETQNLGNFVF